MISDIEYTFALVQGIAIIIGTILLSGVLYTLLFALIIRFSLDEQHLRVKLFGALCISSIAYQEIKDVRVVSWITYWKENWSDFSLTREWTGYAFRRTRVLIITQRSRFPNVLISPADSTAFATALSAKIPKTM